MESALYIFLGVAGVVLIFVFIVSDTRENRNRFAASFQVGAHKARAERNLAEAAEIHSRHDLELEPQRLEERRHLEKLAHANAKLLAENQRVVINNATGMGVSPPTYESIVLKEESNRLDFEKEKKGLEERVRLALLAKHLSEVQKIHLIIESIDRLHRQIDEIEKDPQLSERAKARMIQGRMGTIESLEGLKDERQRRLLAADTQSTPGSFDEDSDI